MFGDHIRKIPENIPVVINGLVSQLIVSRNPLLCDCLNCRAKIPIFVVQARNVITFARF
jgi:hypothetical protein